MFKSQKRPENWPLHLLLWFGPVTQLPKKLEKTRTNFFDKFPGKAQNPLGVFPLAILATLLVPVVP